MKIDIKSLIIGILSTLLIISILGINSEKNLGNIVVNSITIKNNKGDTLGELGFSDKDSISFIRLYGYDKKLTTNIYSSNLGGNIFLKGFDSKSSLGLIGLGVVQVTNSNNKVVATLGNDFITNSSRLRLFTNENKGGLDLFSIYDDSHISTIDENGETRTDIFYEADQKKSAIKLYNSKNNMVLSISENKNGDGQILLGDRDGNYSWGIDGKKK